MRTPEPFRRVNDASPDRSAPPRGSRAPGWPGAEPTWADGDKDAVGGALSPANRCRFTLANGVLTEIFFPDLDRAATRDLQLLVLGPGGAFSEESCGTLHRTEPDADGVPVYRVTNTCLDGRFRIEKLVFADPRRSSVVTRVRFVPLCGAPGDYRVVLTLSPRLNNRGAGNTGWAGAYKGRPLLLAQNGALALAVACGAPWLRRSAGFVGASDAWQDLARHGRMTWAYERAESGHVALAGEIDLSACGGAFDVVIGFGDTPDAAALTAGQTLDELGSGDALRAELAEAWQAWHRANAAFDVPPEAARRDAGRRDLARTSAMVLRVHRCGTFPGAGVASLATPWGAVRRDGAGAGYHVIWTRDLAETTGGLLAAGAREDARQALIYLRATQEPDGRWPQTMWLDGSADQNNTQLDEAAMPVLLAERFRREFGGRIGSGGGGDDPESARIWAMARAAAIYLARHGPSTPQERWEDAGGFSVHTLSVTVAALVVAADAAEARGEVPLALYLRETADAWNDSAERWLYVTDTLLARRVGVAGYYLRLAPPDLDRSGRAAGPPADVPADELVSPDALALVRYGLRDANNPKIIDTVRVIDAVLRTETPFGPGWHRYNGDRYGERADGSPPRELPDAEGHGRCWPLLTGERGHYELAAGRPAEARRLLATMAQFANRAGMIPEQIWDAADVPERELFLGRATGSAMPLAWAHAEYLKLRRSLADGRVFDLPPAVHERYVARRTYSPLLAWRRGVDQPAELPAGKRLRIEAFAPAVVRHTLDGWRTYADEPLRDTTFGVYQFDVPAEGLTRGDDVIFTFRWIDSDQWEGRDYRVRVV